MYVETLSSLSLSFSLMSAFISVKRKKKGGSDSLKIVKRNKEQQDHRHKLSQTTKHNSGKHKHRIEWSIKIKCMSIYFLMLDYKRM